MKDDAETDPNSRGKFSHDDVEGHHGDEQETPDTPPEGGYGWVCVACSFWINANTWGINSVSRDALTESIGTDLYRRMESSSRTTSTTIIFLGQRHCTLPLSVVCPSPKPY